MRKRSMLVSVLVLLSVGAVFDGSDLFAGTTGKISGRVTDVETGQPLPGANVFLVGTSLGSASDPAGFYTILNIPPGTYALRSSFMGYTDKVLENVVVRIDLTTAIDIELGSTVIEGDHVTVIAERPLIQKDITHSLSSVSTEEIKSLPVEEVSQVLALQAGVVRAGGGFHIRGGRSGEIAYWVDGVAITDVYDGGMGLRIENSAIQEMQVISGAYNAEYGRAMSGIVNIITKEGGANYEGEFRSYVGDYYSTSDIYDVWKSVSYNPETGELIEERENPLKKFNPTFNSELTLSGPVPLSSKKLRIFTNARYTSTEGYLYGREWFTPQGLPGDSSLVPLNPYERFSSQAKLTYRPAGDLKISYNLFYNRSQSDHSTGRDFKYVPMAGNFSRNKEITHLLTLNHVLSPLTFYEVRLSHYYRESESYLYEDPLARPHWLVRIAVDSLNPEVVLDLDVESDQSAFEEYKNEERSYTYFIDPANSEGYVHPDSIRTPASYSFNRAGTPRDHSYQSTAYWLGKLDFTSQVHKAHEIKLGAELRLYDVRQDWFQLQAKQNEGNQGQVVPYAPSIPPVSTVFHDNYTREPTEISAYIQDKVEYQNVILNLGLRFDWFDPNYVVPVDPRDPNIYAPFKEEHIYKDWIDPPPGTIGSELDEYKAGFVEYTPEERKAFMHKQAETNWKLSPRVAIAYPITDRGIIHFSYGHFFQIPGFNTIYADPDFKLTTGGGFGIVGNANLKPERTTKYEIGLQQQLTDRLKIDVTMFYQNTWDWVGTGPIIRTYRPVVGYALYKNEDYYNSRGITLQIEKRFIRNYSYRIDYTYSIAEGTYSNPMDAFYAAQANQEPRLNLIPLDWDQLHTLNVQLIYRIKGWTASMIGTYHTGTPYTPQFAKGGRLGGTAFSGLLTNSANLPTIKTIDFFVKKTFKLGGLDLSVFAFIYNLFDLKEEVNVWADTGTAEYTTNPRVEDVPYNASRVSTVEDLLLQPTWYLNPREIQIGFSVGF